MRGACHARVSDILPEGWLATRDPRRLLSVEEIRVGVSTNRIYRLVRHDGRIGASSGGFEVR